MTGLRRTIYALAAAGLRWLARGEVWASVRLADAATWCDARAERDRAGDPRRPQGP